MVSVTVIVRMIRGGFKWDDQAGVGWERKHIVGANSERGLVTTECTTNHDFDFWKKLIVRIISSKFYSHMKPVINF